jgi:glycogen synthase kinase 3 beta
LKKVFRQRTPDEAVELIGKLLVYNPEKRLTPMQALSHIFFDELRDK